MLFSRPFDILLNEISVDGDRRRGSGACRGDHLGPGVDHVVRRPDSTDRRAKLVVLTDKGRACIAAGITTIEDTEDRITETLGERGHRQIRTLLRQLLDAG